jgi:hypothetical protein
MLGKITLAAGLVAVATALGSMSASAAPALPQSKPAAGVGDLVQPVHFRRHHRHHRLRLFRGGLVIGLVGAYGYCRAWRWECADRHGWRSRRFYRCLWRHGC